MYATKAQQSKSGNYQTEIKCSNGHVNYIDQMHANDPWSCYCCSVRL